MRRRLGIGIAVLALALAAPLGCASEEDALLLIGGEKVDASLIDRDPIALLPSEPVLFGSVDAKALFATSLAPSLTEFVTALVPLGAEAHFQPSRDVVKVYGGLYALQGVDFCAVVQGDFDVEAIKKAVAAHSVSALGDPLVASRYADVDLYTAGSVGFALVTAHTLVAGNETGMRRALDRLRRGKLESSIPPWMTDLAKTPNAPLIAAGDFKGQPAFEGVARVLPFLMGAERLRVLGNFHAPGLNLAGALTYPDEPSAVAAAAALKGVTAMGPVVSFFVAGALGGGLPNVTVAQAKHDVAFTSEVDGKLVRSVAHMATTAARATISTH